MILHCTKQSDWEADRASGFYGNAALAKSGMIHCASVENMFYVAPLFAKETAPLVLLCIDEEKLSCEIRWEDFTGSGRLYPHLYGLLNLDAVESVLPFLRDESGAFVLNDELKGYLPAESGQA